MTRAGPPPAAPTPFNLVFVAQAGRLAYEAVLFMRSLRAADPEFSGRIFAAEPAPGPLWDGDPRLPAAVRAFLEDEGAEILPFAAQHFGAAWPQGNKIEALAALPPGIPFVFFDTDTLFTGPLSAVGFDFARPSASMRREGTWPDPPPYGPGHAAIWGALYDRFGLDMAGSLDPAWPEEHWERHLYFSAGWFFGADPADFGARFLHCALSIRNDPPEALASQSLFPWLDQIALPLVIHGLGGGRPGPALAGLDGAVSCHYRALPLLYARESDCAVDLLESLAAEPRVKRLLRDHPPARKLIYQGHGRRLRALFDRAHLPSKEAPIRQEIRRARLWLR